ncbi:MAG TPA: hypothetical protein VFF31_16890 [Blastocatellia bacterium]|nr:hypothetical protein [Blastocatellia bacterium]
MSIASFDTVRRMDRARITIKVAGLALAAGLLIVSQVNAYIGDESLHLVAAQLINAGKRPYADFFYHHTPLFIYLLANLMRLLGENWRVAHAFSATALAGAIILACLYVRDLFVREGSRLAAAALAGLLLGTNCYVLIFATTGLPYGFLLFCLTAALYFTNTAGSTYRLFFAGLCAGAAVSSYLLTLPALVVLVIWVLRRDRARVLVFAVGVLIAFGPLLVLFIESPRQVAQGLFQYHLVNRPDLGWRYSLGELAAWFLSLQGAMLTVLSVVALYFRDDAKVRLCGWIALALSIGLAGVASVKTIDAMYLLLLTPFVTILAAVGTVEIAQRTSRHAKRVVALAALMYLIGLYGIKDAWRWRATYTDYRVVEAIGNDLRTYTPDGGEFYAFEAVYFAVHRVPPPTLENRFNPLSQADERLKEGRFDAVCIGSTDPRVERNALFRRYSQSKEVNLSGYTWLILWDRK